MMEEPSYDPGAVYIGIGVLGLAGLFAFFGVRGFWLYAHNSGSAAADPVISAMALLVTPWLAALARKLLRRHHPAARLFSGPELLVCSLAAISGAIWSVVGGFPHAGFVIGGLGSGTGGLLLWWRRRRQKAP